MLWIKEGIDIRMDRLTSRHVSLGKLIQSWFHQSQFRVSLNVQSTQSILVDQNATNYIEWPLGVIRLHHLNPFDQIKTKSGVLRCSKSGVLLLYLPWKICCVAIAELPTASLLKQGEIPFEVKGPESPNFSKL